MPPRGSRRRCRRLGATGLQGLDPLPHLSTLVEPVVVGPWGRAREVRRRYRCRCRSPRRPAVWGLVPVAHLVVESHSADSGMSLGGGAAWSRHCRCGNLFRWVRGGGRGRALSLGWIPWCCRCPCHRPSQNRVGRPAWETSEKMCRLRSVGIRQCRCGLSELMCGCCCCCCRGVLCCWVLDGMPRLLSGHGQ